MGISKMSPQSLNDGNTMTEHPSSQKMRIVVRILAAVSVAFLIPVIRIQAAAAEHLLYVSKSRNPQLR
jgi:hypothetical protein